MAYQRRAPDQTTDENTSNHRLYNPYQDLHLPAQILYNLPTSPEFLFQEESVTQRRSWGENLTYYTGIGYLTGATAGAAKGFATGAKSIEPSDTLKLKVNRILNGSGHAGRQIGNRCGIIGLMYAGLESGMVAVRDADDVINSVVAGLGTGALFKAAAGPRSAAVAGAIGGVLVGLAVTGKQDKWRNVGANHGQCCGANSMTPKKGKATATSAVTPKPKNSSPVFVFKGNSNDKPPKSPQDVKDAPKHNAMILEAISTIKDRDGSDFGAILGFIEKKFEVPQGFRRSLSSKLRRLVSQGTLEKVQKRYKIKSAALGTNTATPKQKDVRSKSLQSCRLTISAETLLEEAAKTAAHKIAEAENKAFVAAEAVKESERVSQMAEDADAVLMRLKEIFEWDDKDNTSLKSSCEVIFMV